jgi:hypothetical protein
MHECRGVKGKVHGPLGADSGIGGAIPAHEGFVVPQPKLPAPAVAAFCDRHRPFGVKLQQFAPLMHFERVHVDAGYALIPRLPGAPPGEMDRYTDRLDEAAGDADAAKMRPDDDDDASGKSA